MTQPERLPEIEPDHETQALADYHLKLARVALFDELIDMHHDGMCSFEEAVAQYKHDLQDLEI